jgi:hypothetical protein
VADEAPGEPDRPLLTEMAEKLRQARGSSFSDRPEPSSRPEPAAAGSRDEPRPAPSAPPQPPADAGPEPFQASLRIDSLERRLFELRAALEDAGVRPVPASAGDRAPAPADSAAWVAFAAAAMAEYDDAKDQAVAADQLLAEYRARRVRGGLLGGEA